MKTNYFWQRVLCITTLVVTLYWTNDTFFTNTDNYAQASHHQIVTVRSGDSVWSIATNYTSNKEDIRELIAAIKQINHLDNNLQIRPGQELKIPIRSTNSYIASREAKAQ